MPGDERGSIVDAMKSETTVPGSAAGLVFMVEAFRSDPPGHPGLGPGVVAAGVEVLAVIDVPADEVALFLIAAPDAGLAEHLVRDAGMRPIRVVAVQWDVAWIRQP
jgi:hypothetical protein